MGSISKPLLPGYLACVPLSCFPNGNTESIARVKKNKPLLLEHLHVLVGGGPDAKSVICMVDKVHLSFVGQPGSRQERWRQGNGCQHCFSFNVREFCKDGLPYHTRI